MHAPSKLKKHVFIYARFYKNSHHEFIYSGIYVREELKDLSKAHSFRKSVKPRKY